MNSSGSSRHMRMARHPRNGFASVGKPPTGSLSPPMSKVRMITGVSAEGLDHARVRPVLLVLVRHGGAVDDEELGAHQARRRRRRCVGGELRFLGHVDVGAQRDPRAVTRDRIACVQIARSSTSALASSRDALARASISSARRAIISVPSLPLRIASLAALEVGASHCAGRPPPARRATARGWRRAPCACRRRSRSR